jgi:osmoprotectant transport system ATP-binding protein
VRLALGEEMLAIHRALGTTILFVTHDVDEALRIADRIIIMQEGHIIQADEPLRVLARPATPYVEQLLDARDAVRRLQLLRARDALGRDGTVRGTPRGHASIEGNRSLREALSLLLEGSDSIAVFDKGRCVGTLGFEDVRAALSATEQ